METDDAMRVAGLNVESGDTPAKPEDYLFVNGHRLVSAAPSCRHFPTRQSASAGCRQPPLAPAALARCLTPSSDYTCRSAGQALPL